MNAGGQPRGCHGGSREDCGGGEIMGGMIVGGKGLAKNSFLWFPKFAAHVPSAGYVRKKGDVGEKFYVAQARRCRTAFGGK